MARGNERDIQFYKNSDERFKDFEKKIKYLSLGSKNYLIHTMEVFAKMQGRLEGVIFYKYIEKKIKNEKIPYAWICNEITVKCNTNRIYETGHLRLTVKRKSYNSEFTEYLKIIFKLHDVDIEKEFRKKFEFREYLNCVYISLNELTQKIFIEVADSLYYAELTTASQQYFNDFNEENDNGLVDTKRLQDMYKQERLMSEEEYKEYKEQEQYLDYAE